MGLDRAAERRKVIATARATRNPKLRHIAHDASVRNYQRIADEVAAGLPPGAQTLDWGAGKGHLTWLLANRGLAVTGYKVREGASKNIPFPVKIVFSREAERLPFDDASLDAVVSCGVLEHVPEPEASVAEIARVVRPGGRFFIYFLPSRWSYTERLNDLRGVSDHPVKYSPALLADLLSRHHFALARVARANFLPQTLPRGSRTLQRMWDVLGPLWYGVDRLGSRLPGINLVCGVLEGVAIRDT
ncbi:MAG: methyltransferase domain-containing protein [Myxococcota bacterium]